MKILFTSLFLFFATRQVHSHLGHDDEPAKGETVQQYAQRHMASEHHIDSFDIRSFFQIHDLNRDGLWDREEIEAIYGVHHLYSQHHSKDEVEHQQKADHIVNAVLKIIDQDRDGKITPAEFEAVGLDGLPNFDDLGAEGHHYDIESEFFLHHEEKFHNTPETQTDESYNHPEDIEHFAHHEAIERKEAEKEAKFQGVPVEEVLEAQHAADERRAAAAKAAKEAQDDQAKSAQDSPMESAPPKSKLLRAPSSEVADTEATLVRAILAGKQEEWGQGDAGYKTPKTPVDRMRKGLPYKYKFRRNWGDF